MSKSSVKKYQYNSCIPIYECKYCKKRFDLEQHVLEMGETFSTSEVEDCMELGWKTEDPFYLIRKHRCSDEIRGVAELIGMKLVTIQYDGKYNQVI